jgi:hypothetical protein
MRSCRRRALGTLGLSQGQAERLYCAALGVVGEPGVPSALRSTVEAKISGSSSARRH